MFDQRKPFMDELVELSRKLKNIYIYIYRLQVSIAVTQYYNKKISNKITKLEQNFQLYVNAKNFSYLKR